MGIVFSTSNVAALLLLVLLLLFLLPSSSCSQQLQQQVPLVHPCQDLGGCYQYCFYYFRLLLLYCSFSPPPPLDCAYQSDWAVAVSRLRLKPRPRHSWIYCRSSVWCARARLLLSSPHTPSPQPPASAIPGSRLQSRQVNA